MHKQELPSWCQILDELISEIAKERSQNTDEAREVCNRKKWREVKGGVDASLQATYAPPTAVTHQTPVKGGGPN